MWDVLGPIHVKLQVATLYYYPAIISEWNPGGLLVSVKI